MGKNLMIYAFSPITMVSPGGFLAVTYFENRASTEDIDIIIDPEHANDKDIAGAIYQVVADVGAKLGFGEGWISDHVALFLKAESRQSIFDEAERQNIVLWKGENLRILAAPFEWCLETKLRRLSTKPNHPKALTDVSDVLEILSRMMDHKQEPLRREVVQALNRNGFDAPINDQALDRVAAAYRERYAQEVFC
jgi:hypothetical protein